MIKQASFKQSLTAWDRFISYLDYDMSLILLVIKALFVQNFKRVYRRFIYLIRCVLILADCVYLFFIYG